ncbi:MAG: DUF2203 domain-containing protein [Ardenticatenales bacterium]|nr:DUF2203 domain-containing protein [Ardenticatenales bacterium]
MMSRLFTVAEANALLPIIRPLVAEMVDRSARAASIRTENAQLIGDLQSNIGSADLSVATADFLAIDQLVNKIRSYGLVVKDINVGLIDFLAEIDGQEVYLCWRYGESKVAYYHELEAGFNGRKRLD